MSAWREYDCGTDIGPACESCGSNDGHSIWVYRVRNGEVTAVCMTCHKTTGFDIDDSMEEWTVTQIRERHDEVYDASGWPRMALPGQGELPANLERDLRDRLPNDWLDWTKAGV